MIILFININIIILLILGLPIFSHYILMSSDNLSPYKQALY